MLSFARVRALAVLAFLIVGALVSVGLALSRDSGQPEVQGCPAGWPTADLTLREEREVKINVINGTGRDNVAAQVSDTFANRDFDVVEHFDDSDVEVEGVGLLRYGPAGVGSAQLVRAYFLNQVELEFQLDREDDVVDVIVGENFQQLATPKIEERRVGKECRSRWSPYH